MQTQPEMMVRRRSIVEHPFGNLKQWILGNGRFLLRQLQGARTEMALAVSGYNLKRAINVLGARRLMRPPFWYLRCASAHRQDGQAKHLAAVAQVADSDHLGFGIEAAKLVVVGGDMYGHPGAMCQLCLDFHLHAGARQVRQVAGVCWPSWCTTTDVSTRMRMKSRFSL